MSDSRGPGGRSSCLPMFQEGRHSCLPMRDRQDACPLARIRRLVLLPTLSCLVLLAVAVSPAGAIERFRPPDFTDSGHQLPETTQPAPPAPLGTFSTWAIWPPPWAWRRTSAWSAARAAGCWGSRWSRWPGSGSAARGGSPRSGRSRTSPRPWPTRTSSCRLPCWRSRPADPRRLVLRADVRGGLPAGGRAGAGRGPSDPHAAVAGPRARAAALHLPRRRRRLRHRGSRRGPRALRHLQIRPLRRAVSHRRLGDDAHARAGVPGVGLLRRPAVLPLRLSAGGDPQALLPGLEAARHIPPEECIKCKLCEDACPYGAILEPTVEQSPEERLKGRPAAGGPVGGLSAAGCGVRGLGHCVAKWMRMSSVITY